MITLEYVLTAVNTLFELPNLLYKVYTLNMKGGSKYDISCSNT